MKPYRWAPDKNEQLKATRDVSFEMVVEALGAGKLKGAFTNSRGQRCLIILLHDYPHIVPTVENDEEIFLKTIFPDRRYK